MVAMQTCGVVLLVGLQQFYKNKIYTVYTGRQTVQRIRGSKLNRSLKIVARSPNTGIIKVF